MRGHLEAALATLAIPYRDVIVLRFFDGLAPGRVAERLNLPVETVRTRTRRGLAQLRERLDRSYGGDRRAWTVALLRWAGWEGQATALVGTTMGAGWALLFVLLPVLGIFAWVVSDASGHDVAVTPAGDLARASALVGGWLSPTPASALPRGQRVRHRSAG